jgi:hypothetical protein
MEDLFRSWVGPAVTAVVVSALFNAIGWFVTSWQTRRADQRRRAEKIRDITLAITAEIDHNINKFTTLDLDDHLAEMKNEIRKNHDFSPMIPRYQSVPAFSRVMEQISILPPSIIGPITAYYKFEFDLQNFADDLRSDTFRNGDNKRKIQMYEDYIEMIKQAQLLGKEASRIGKAFLDKR